jgi:hypothetical protein
MVNVCCQCQIDSVERLVAPPEVLQGIDTKNVKTNISRPHRKHLVVLGQRLFISGEVMERNPPLPPNMGVPRVDFEGLLIGFESFDITL